VGRLRHRKTREGIERESDDDDGGETQKPIMILFDLDLRQMRREPV
jgi:hypothetical protein